MPIKADYRQIRINVADGHALAPDMPLHLVRPGDFTTLQNFRPVNAGELEKIEGWDYFAPNPAETVGESDDALAQRLNAPAGCLAIKEVTRPNGKAAVVCVAGAKIYAFTYDTHVWTEIGSGYATAGIRRWEIEEVAGYAVFNNGVDLFCTWQVGDAAVRPAYEFREQGYASAGTICEFNGILICMDILEILDAELSAILNGGTPYAAITDPTKTQRVQFERLWSNIGDPRDFAATVDGSGTAGTPNVTLTHPMASLAIGNEITVVGGGTAGGNLVTTISNLAGTALTLANNLVTSITSQPVQKTTALNSIVGSDELEDDGSAILRGLRFKNRLVTAKANSIFVSYYTGDIDEPFANERVYSGASTPRFPAAMVNVQDRYLWWPGERHFYRFTLGQQEPEIDPVIRPAQRALFFNRAGGVDPVLVFAAIDPCSNEICLFYPYAGGNRMIRRGFTPGEEYVFEVDDGFACACAIHKPLAGGVYDKTELWFLYGGSDGKVVRNGRSNFAVFTQRRYGVDFYATALSGLLDFGDSQNEKDVRSYTLLMSNPAGSLAVEFSLYGSDNTNLAPTLLETVTLNDPEYPGVARLFYRRTYFQELLRTNANAAVKIAGRIWEVALVNSRSVVRTSP